MPGAPDNPLPARATPVRIGRRARRERATYGRRVGVRYLWWRSSYDGVLHAFPLPRGARLAHQHYRASCAHAAPPDLDTSGAPAPRCELCLLILGEPSG